MSETKKYREELSRFCVGYGVDLGYGGDPIIPSAITIDLPKPYTNLGDHPLNLGGDARNLFWFTDNSLDYVYSSHLLEDFKNTKEVLVEWSRVLKKGGKLILLLPDQKRYEIHCKKHCVEPNAAHKIKNFGLHYIKKQFEEIPNLKLIYEKDCLVDDYNFLLVAEKIEKTASQCLNCIKIENEMKSLELLVKDNDRIIEELREKMKRNEKTLHQIRSSLRWKIPNYFYKLYKKLFFSN